MKILTFDLEDWFHILDNESTKSSSQWGDYESRIRIGTEIILNILTKHNLKATFFVLGWIAEKYPQVVKEINSLGFEIGSHTHFHQLVYSQNKIAFHNDVEKSIKTIEDCIGKRVKYFRAPGFSITENTLWAFEVLNKLKIEVDSSIFPSKRSHGGFASYSDSKPSIINYSGAKIKEFPINTFNFFGKPFVYSGGGYFRILNYRIIKYLTKNNDYVMSYFHPRDFDYDQPVLKGLSHKRKFKSYVGIKNSRKKLERWVTDFNFVDLSTAVDSINWKKTKIINL